MVKFDNLTRELYYCYINIYFDCDNCKPQMSIAEELLSNPYNNKEIQSELTSDNNVYCKILNTISVQGGLF